jgi:hypothetical protein
MRKQINLVIAIALLGSIGATTTTQPKHLADAEMLIDNISPQNNIYEHKGCFIKWKGEDGATKYENRSDCSDFLALLVKHSYGVTSQQLKQWTGHIRPYADHWHDAIVSDNGFEHITKLADAKPGDVLAVKFPPGLPDTGHVMMIAEQPEKITAKAPIVNGTQQWNVTIIDSTKSPHGPGDTRIQSDGSSSTGVGRGMIRIYTTSTGEVAGYTWSDGSKAKFEAEDDRNMAIGRLTVAK